MSIRAFVTVGTIAVFSSLGLYSSYYRHVPLKLRFPTALLMDSKITLNPKNLNTIWEYYLLENLGAGLVRDSSSSSSGFVGDLAESWERISDTQWKFNLRPQIKWSDGRSITSETIGKFFMGLKNSPGRHHTLIRRLSKVSTEKSSVTLFFEVPTDDSILGELSLADSFVTSDELFNRTSGPYALDSFNTVEHTITLKKNLHYVLGSSSGAERVILIPTNLPMYKAVEDDVVDVAFNPTYPFLLQEKSTKPDTGPRVIVGGQSNVFLTYFSEKAFRSSTRGIRSELRRLLSYSFDKLPNHEHMDPESQVIPLGYAGHLPGLTKDRHFNIQSTLKGKKFVIAVWPVILKFQAYFDSLKSIADSAGISLDIIPVELGAKVDADLYFYTFKGNQRDFCGSFAFLFSDQSPFSYLKKSFKSELERLQSAGTKAEREKVCFEIHSKILKDEALLPVFSSAGTMVLSPALELQNYDLFDMRLRFLNFVRK